MAGSFFGSVADIYKEINKTNEQASKRLEKSLPESAKSKLNRSNNDTKKHQWLSEEMLLINNLAKAWDKWKQSENNSIKPRLHLFYLFITSVSRYNPIVKAELHNYKEPPDERIIGIAIRRSLFPGRNKRDRMLSMLHEVGHYIGHRLRREKENASEDSKHDRLSLFSHLVAGQLCNLLHRHLIFHITGISFSNIPMNIEYDFYMESAVTKLSFELRALFQKEYKQIHEKLKNQLCKKLKNIIDSIDDKCNQIREKPEITPDDSLHLAKMERIKLATSKGYFQYIIPVMREVVSEFNTGDISQSFHNRLLELCGVNKETLENVLSDVRQSLKTDENKRDWIDACGELLQEIAADLFMLQVTKVSLWKYSMLIVNATIDLLKEKKVPLKYIDIVMNNSVILPRIVAVCNTFFLNERISFPKWQEILMQWKLTRRAIAQEKAFGLIEGTIREYVEFKQEGEDQIIQDIFNPIMNAITYANKVNQEYEKKSCNTVQECINNLRKYIFRSAMYT